MTPLDKRFKHEEQILMRREVASIKTRMSQIVEHARSGRMQQVEGMMLLPQMQGMAQQIIMIRQRCLHIWESEYVYEDGEYKHTNEICVICESRQRQSS